ncbi:MAG: uracil-DNA glycosylase [Bacteroidota bacterium]|nr:uracil-DNA glycosylase [Bacteroidota bacterium]
MPDINTYTALQSLNKEIKHCRRCRLWEQRTHAIVGEGNIHARIFLIAQAPGEKEDKEGCMFVGPTGDIINQLFDNVHIKRSDVYMTNLIKCMLPKNRKPKQDEINACSRFLDAEIDIINPEIIVPMGYQATKYVFKKYGHPDNIPEQTAGKLFYRDGHKIYPIHHPSSVLYHPDYKETLSTHFRKLDVFSQPCKWYPTCPMHHFTDLGKLDKKWTETFCKGDWESCVRYQKEEAGIFHPDNMLPDGNIDKSLM